MKRVRTNEAPLNETPTSSSRIAILGAGRLGQAVGAVLKSAGADVHFWEAHDEARAALQKDPRPGLSGVPLTGDLEEAVTGAGTVLFAVPAPAMLPVAEAYGAFARGDHVVLHAVRGVAPGFVLPHEALRQKTCVLKIGALGGPLYFDDDGRRRPLFVVLGTRFPEVTARIKKLTERTLVRLHPCSDILGVEVAGAISNVSHLAAGMADGLELGETARGVLLCRGLAEATTLGCALGADPSTFAGLAGVGDLIPRAVSSTARHDVLGRRVAEGEAPADVLAEIGGHVEGVVTAREARKKAEDLGLDLPLVRAVADILDGEADPGLRLDEILDLDLDLGGDALRRARATAALH